jgi:alkanesulfonate monooxygenase SsuD/methylene tetrahydromethanopterin reductase-like flavin-dependent oxidoreductase (luciferase family)
MIEPDHYGLSLPIRIGAPGDPALAAARQRLLGRMPNAERGEMAKSFAVGTADEVATLLRHYVAAGMSKFVLLPLVDGAADLMEQTELLVRRVLPEVEDRVAA